MTSVPNFETPAPEPHILLAGFWMWPFFEQAAADALTSLGARVTRFAWFDDFYEWRPGIPEPQPRSFPRRLQNRLVAGPAVRSMNERLIRLAVDERPNVILFHNPTHVYPSTVRRLRKLLPHTTLVQYANDNPFGGMRHYWRHLRRALPEYDVHFAFRHSNIRDYLANGANEVHLLRGYYMPDKVFRDVPTDERLRSDVVFAGHYEPDGRLEALEGIARAGWNLRVFGGSWSRVPRFLSPDSPLRSQLPILPVLGSEYRQALSGAAIALCFLSRLNRDTYTLRNFEIPAVRTLMLSEYTDDLASLFEEGVEADYFRSHDELLDKVAFYMNNPAVRERVAHRGHERLLRDGHDVRSRMRSFLDTVWPGPRYP
ncbi:MAG: glycosyltransferase [Acidobacteria bacterium]|nr:glycosyltransferase [Acidobacteriota bacterium]